MKVNAVAEQKCSKCGKPLEKVSGAMPIEGMECEECFGPADGLYNRNPVMTERAIIGDAKGQPAYTYPTSSA